MGSSYAHPFSRVLTTALCRHTASLIYPLRSPQDYELNKAWIENHWSNQVDPQDLKLDEFYRHYLFHDTLDHTRGFSQKQYAQLLTVREKIINSYALGLLESTLFQSSPGNLMYASFIKNATLPCYRIAQEVLDLSPECKALKSNDEEFLKHIRVK